MKPYTRRLWWWWSLVWCVSTCGAAGVRPAPVELRRCCGVGDALLPSERDEPPVWSCSPAASGPAAADASWLPRVYAPAKRTYLERGRTPPHWRVRERSPPGCDEPAALRYVPDRINVPYLLLAGNGSLMLPREGATVPPSRFCVELGGALVCESIATGAAETNGSAGRVALAVKCCPAGRAFDADGARCVPDEVASEAAAAELRSLGGETSGAGATLGGGWPACEDGRYAVVGALRAGSLREDGALRLGSGLLAAGAWCAESLVAGGDETGAHVLACGGARGRAAGRHAVYGAGLAVGAAFLAATLAAGCVLPAAHHALHWRCQTHYVAALLLGDVLLAATQLAGDSVPPTLCKVLAVCMHFLFLSAFFWLNTMCFNIWWTFRDFRPTSLERGQEACRLRVYSVYAWGGPLLLAGAAALLDHLPPDPAYTFLRPRFAVQRCWFYGDLEILTYFFGPVGVLLLVNLALFASTARQLTCGLWRRDEVKSTSERAALGRVCAKLVVVMGVTWGADVVSWAAGGPDYVWYLTDLLNALQGVFIFVVVGCQPAAWAHVKRWWERCVRRGGGAGRGAGGEAAGLHSSTHLPSCQDSLTNTTAPGPAPAAPTTQAAAPVKIPMETVC